MEPIVQPKGSALCGQYCVAMITGQKVDEIRKKVGVGRDAKGTKRKHLSRVLNELGFRMSRKITSKRMDREFFGNIGTNALIYVGRQGDLDHWILWDAANLRLLDPNIGVRKRFPKINEVKGFFLVSGR